MLPKVIATSVIRASEKGQSHGGLYVIDLDKSTFELTLDWADKNIDFEGRGGERGLRGVAVYKEDIYLGSNSQLFRLDKKFEILEVYENPYLDNIHEIFIDGKDLLICSTGYDSIIKFNLETKKVHSGFLFRRITEHSPFQKFLHRVFKSKFHVSKTYDPTAENGPHRADTTHINSVFVHEGKIYYSGTGTEFLYEVKENGGYAKVAAIPRKTHNGRYYRGHVFYNNTPTNIVKKVNVETGHETLYNIPPVEGVVHSVKSESIATKGFNRGMLFYNQYLIVGSSPSNITVFNIDTGEFVKQLVISTDVRNAIHGIALL